jgi:hypothetical protein
LIGFDNVHLECAKYWNHSSSAFGLFVIESVTVLQDFVIFIPRIGNFTITLSHEVKPLCELMLVKSTVHDSNHEAVNLTHEKPKNVSKSELHCVNHSASSAYSTNADVGVEVSDRLTVYVL